MNTEQCKNNRYKNGEYNPNRSIQMAKEKARSIEPTSNQVQYRDDLYKFCIQKGIVRDGFKLGRSRQMISANIRAFITILEKNGLSDEFFGRKAKEPAEEGAYNG